MLQSPSWIISFTMLLLPAAVWGHARLMSPPSRSSMWRLGFRTKKNFNDNALYCGGIQVQWQRNGGKCGICGDPFDMPYPRDNEAGGKYGQGIISRQYLSGQVMEATVDVTTNHRGYFEFKLCASNNPKKEVTQVCLDKYTLKLADGRETKYYITDKGNGNITVKLQLPKGLVCSQCVFQWTYVAGNNWGGCDDGVSRLGCGPQETFRGCADIAVKKYFNIDPYKGTQNNIKNKPQTDSFYRGKPSKYTSIPKHPKYNMDVSRVSQSTENTHSTQAVNKKFDGNKKKYHFSSWLIPNVNKDPVRDTVLLNGTSQKSLSTRDSHQQHTYFENINSDSLPTARSPYVVKFSDKDGTSVTEHPSVLVFNKMSQLRKMFRQQKKDMHLLRFYLQEDPSTSHSQDYAASSREFTSHGREYKDFWYL